MAFCKKCGAQVKDGSRFCSNCGSVIEEDLAAKFQSLNNTTDTTDEYDLEDIQKNKLKAALCYLSIFIVVPVFTAKDSRFVRFHISQGMTILTIDLALNLISKLVSSFGIISFIIDIAHIVLFALMVIGIMNVIKGRAKELPLVGKIKLI